MSVVGGSIMNCGLTLDLDDISIEDSEVIELMNWLSKEFGSESVWYRKSSSGDGLHVMIAHLVIAKLTGVPSLMPILMSVDEQMEYRNKIKLECRGRRISDSYRKEVGLRTSRIFSVKNGKESGQWQKWKPPNHLSRFSDN